MNKIWRKKNKTKNSLCQSCHGMTEELEWNEALWLHKEIPDNILPEWKSWLLLHQDFPLFLSFTLLVLKFFVFVTVTSACLSHRGLQLVLETLQRILYLSGVLTFNRLSYSGEFEATDSSKYSSATPYCVRVDRKQFLVLTLTIEQKSSWLYSHALKTINCCRVIWSKIAWLCNPGHAWRHMSWAHHVFTHENKPHLTYIAATEHKQVRGSWRF